MLKAWDFVQKLSSFIIHHSILYLIFMHYDIIGTIKLIVPYWYVFLTWHLWGLVLKNKVLHSGKLRVILVQKLSNCSTSAKFCTNVVYKMFKQKSCYFSSSCPLQRLLFRKFQNLPEATIFVLVNWFSKNFSVLCFLWAKEWYASKKKI